jgi:hypothetical protein
MIPNVAHYIYFDGPRPFGLVHYLAIASMRRVSPETTIILHCESVPRSEWWDRISGDVQVRQAQRPREIYGVPLSHPAHQTDVLRLSLIREQGGIFLDLDVIAVRSFAPLLSETCVLAYQDRQGRKGLGCAVMLARPEDPFIVEWIAGYDPARSRWQGFRSRGYDEHWAEMSTRYPALLAREAAHEIRVLDSNTFYPFGFEQDELEDLFERWRPLDEVSYCIHLWEQRSWDLYLRDLTIAELCRSRSTFARCVSDLL